MLKLSLKIFVELTGNKYLSRALAAYTSSKYSRLLVPLFASVYKLNKDDMRYPLSSYTSLQALFTRQLKPGIRPIDAHTSIAVSPVDGVISDYGTIKDGTTVPVKGLQLSVSELLGGEKHAASFDGGKFIVIYLSPQHYHRIHSPVNGRVINSRTLGGKSYPVNKWGLRYGTRPLSTNFRKITEVDIDSQKCAIVAVGALNVNSIHITNQSDKLEKGEEIGFFSFGSTVILLFENMTFSALTPNQSIKVGEKIGTIS
ncbi:phosphatidylserine decarboxylase [Terribacillus aidingensis]|uniref:phosphatidylserine decarboxylase n=1 Tax=Terribacillus aidingensis TaxID=586416 RepID=A0A285P759_9BACI|nr:phosphatidylserine decarboxylase [Terribacillus aidingensis]SNZ15711.1 phosphatidylserine decarboxylase [Terribacillus aidingensis]